MDDVVGAMEIDPSVRVEPSVPKGKETFSFGGEKPVSDAVLTGCEILVIKESVSVVLEVDPSIAGSGAWPRVTAAALLGADVMT